MQIKKVGEHVVFGVSSVTPVSVSVPGTQHVTLVYRSIIIKVSTLIFRDLYLESTQPPRQLLLEINCGCKSVTGRFFFIRKIC